jgi:hypothetical protein
MCRTGLTRIPVSPRYAGGTANVILILSAMNTARLTVLVALASGLASMSVAHAQTSPPSTPPSTAEPDARYPNPSGQDSQPGKTQPKTTKPATSSKTPQDSRTTSQARNESEVSGKKADVAGGCSTPTDAASAHTSTHEPPTDQSKKRVASKGEQTVCTTTGENPGVTKNSKVASEDDHSTSNPQKPAPEPR